MTRLFYLLILVDYRTLHSSRVLLFSFPIHSHFLSILSMITMSYPGPITSNILLSNSNPSYDIPKQPMYSRLCIHSIECPP
ncbi:hypothetical protein M413DRAFT_82858 [Hebeloma cylindrosporum]|uniref:Uncharacterized protein n=1 Tax=Hebeloma cylindrosporum TaxID=76867 RepID=A0A0C2Z659_HEBCY|nr:hypothetical protein M413DRAFT_82858 [Hebeloma cylindrosporum h7]